MGLFLGADEDDPPPSVFLARKNIAFNRAFQSA